MQPINAPFAEHNETAAINTTVDITLPVELTMRPHLFVGVYTDNSGTPTLSGAGTISLSAQMLNNPQSFEAFANGTTQDATALINNVDAAGNFVKVRVVSTGLTNVDGIVTKITAQVS